MSFCAGSGEMQTGVRVGRGTSAVLVGGAIVDGGMDVEVTVTGFPQDETTIAKARNINILFIMFTRPYKKVVNKRV